APAEVAVDQRHARVACPGRGERQVGRGEAGTLLPQRAGDPDHRAVLCGPPQRARVPQPVQQHAVLLGGRALRIGQGHEPLVDGHLGPSALDALEERCPGPRYRLRNAGHDVLLSPGRPGCIRPAPSATPATTAPGPSPTRAGAGPWPAPAAPAPPPLPRCAAYGRTVPARRRRRCPTPAPRAARAAASAAGSGFPVAWAPRPTPARGTRPA